MQFLVVTNSRHPMAPEMAMPMMAAMRQWVEEHTSSGTIDPMWAFAGQPGGGGVVNVDSLEELDAAMAGFPFAGHSDIQIYPLVDIHGALDRFDAVMQQMMEGMGSPPE